MTSTNIANGTPCMALQRRHAPGSPYRTATAAAMPHAAEFDAEWGEAMLPRGMRGIGRARRLCGRARRGSAAASEDAAWAAALQAAIAAAAPDGDRFAMQALQAAVLGGLARWLIEAARAHASARVIGGRPIADYQLTMAKLADMAVCEAVIEARLHLLAGVGMAVADALPAAWPFADSCAQTIAEIRRSAARIVGLTVELMAGSAFVQAHSDPSAVGIAMALLGDEPGAGVDCP